MKRFVITLFLLVSATSANSAILVFSPNETGVYTTKRTLAEANSDADVAGKTVVVTSVLSAVQSNISSATVHKWSSDRKLVVEKGGKINNTTVFDLSGVSFQDGIYQMFGGTGRVIGLTFSRPQMFGGTGSAHFQKAINASKKVKLSAGAYAISGIQLNAVSHVSLEIEGEGSGEVTITNDSTADMFIGSGGISNFSLEDVTISTTANAGHIFNGIMGSFSHLNRVYIVQNNPAKSIIYQRGGGPAQAKFENGRWTHAAGATTYAVDILIDDGDGSTNFFNVTFENLMCDSSMTARKPFFRFYNYRQTGTGPSWGPTFKNITLEVMGGGGIELLSPNDMSLEHVIVDDLTGAPANPIVKIIRVADKTPQGLIPSRVRISDCHLKTSYGSNTFPDVYISASGVTIESSLIGYMKILTSGTASMRPITIGSTIEAITSDSDDIPYPVGTPPTSGLIFDPLNTHVHAVDSHGLVFTPPPPTVASASFIAITSPVTFVSGTTDIDGIGITTALSSWSTKITLIPTGVWHMTTDGAAGGIAKTVTAVVNKALDLYYDTVTQKWYPSY